LLEWIKLANARIFSWSVNGLEAVLGWRNIVEHPRRKILKLRLLEIRVEVGGFFDAIAVSHKSRFDDHPRHTYTSSEIRNAGFVRDDIVNVVVPNIFA